ncbi:hypothetical protein, partial [Bartonella sp. CL74QHWL]|uniref:hypothetical protein n=1 Tax=Bartonella sp. CL74QHWL TaxID=3243541 RepID=UPI0035CFFB63
YLAKSTQMDFFDIFFKAQTFIFHKAFMRKLPNVNITKQCQSPKGAQQRISHLERYHNFLFPR